MLSIQLLKSSVPQRCKFTSIRRFSLRPSILFCGQQSVDHRLIADSLLLRYTYHWDERLIRIAREWAANVVLPRLLHFQGATVDRQRG
jgi:hypothetical protein